MGMVTIFSDRKEYLNRTRTRSVWTHHKSYNKFTILFCFKNWLVVKTKKIFHGKYSKIMWKSLYYVHLFCSNLIQYFCVNAQTPRRVMINVSHVVSWFYLMVLSLVGGFIVSRWIVTNFHSPRTDLSSPRLLSNLKYSEPSAKIFIDANIGVGTTWRLRIERRLYTKFKTFDLDQKCERL